MKKSLFLVGVLAVMFTACTTSSTAPNAQDVLAAHDKEIDAIIAQMTLEEKVAMLHSKTIMSSEGVPRLGIQEIRYADGPFAIREEIGDRFRPLEWKTDSATYYPTGSALAATWSYDMAYKYGTGMGTEGRRRGKDLILGPAINIQRLPVCGRSYEYLSEDPFLSGRLTVGYTKGSQDAGTGVCLKHYAVNNQELNRGSVNAVVDERTLREIYLKPFEAGVKEGGAYSVMTAYNKVNGDYCSENAHLNNEILRGDWGFKGLTVSDWGGTHSTMGAALCGLDVQMTGDNYLGPALIDSVKAGKVPESVVDDKVREILRVRFTVEPIPADKCNIDKTSRPEQWQIAYEVASKSIVLLKNEGKLLPINVDKVKKIAVVGPRIETLTARGGVGAGAKSPYEISALKGLQDRIGDKVELVYSETDMEVARGADVVIFVGGTTREQESEGRDRNDMFLPDGQDDLLKALAEINPNIVTVIQSGGPCDLRVAEPVSKALVQAWWNGLEGGHALADVLLGKIAPSGKLPFTFPIKLEDSPAYALGVYPQADPMADLFASMYRQDRAEGRANNQRANAPRANAPRANAPRPGAQAGQMPSREEMARLRRMFSPTARYTEGLYVGYRWFDTKQLPVMYAFGHGLSYVDFKYSDIKVASAKYQLGDVIKVTFTLKNTGDMEAEEVAQLYVSRPGATVDWPSKELKAFERVALKAGESKKVTLTVPVAELRYWNTDESKWDLEGGKLGIMVGSGSDDIRLNAETSIVVAPDKGLAFNEVRTAANNVLVAFFNNDKVNIGAVETADLSKWTLNGKPVNAIHKYVTEADACEYHIYLDVPELVPGQKYTLSTPYGKKSFTFNEKDIFCESIKTNQVGYSALSKVRYANFAIWLGDGGARKIEGALPEYSVIKEDSGEEILSGKLQEIGADKSSGDYVYRIDLSAVPEGGPYKVVVKGYGSSYPFGVGDRFSKKLAWTSFRALYHQRCGVPVVKPYADWDIRTKPCHETIYLTYGPIGEARLKVTGKEPTIKAWGGYHDAGDADRRTYHMNVSSSLLTTFEMFPEFFKDDQFNIPDKFDENFNILGKGNGIPDIIDEAEWGTMFWEYVQTETGEMPWGTETTGYSPFTTYDREDHLFGTEILHPITAAWASALFVHLARIIEPYKPERAKELIAHADLARKSLGNAKFPTFDMYYNIEKYLMTGDQKYHAYVKAHASDVLGIVDTYNVGTEAFADRGAWLPSYFCSYILADDSKTDPKVKALFVEALHQVADKELGYLAENAYPVGTPLTLSWWGSNTAQGQYAYPTLLYWKLSGEQKYMDAVSQLMDYSVGLNPMGKCFMTGVGYNQVCHPHDRESAYTKDEMHWGNRPGILVFGPGLVTNAGKCYPVIKRGETPRERIYIDNRGAISQSEYTIYQSLCFPANVYPILTGGSDYDNI